MRTSRWFIFAPVAILALFAPQANAEPVAGLNTTYYTIDSVPPTRSEHIYTECGSEVENNINRSYDGEPFIGCPDDMFMVHITGTIIIPAHETIQFWIAADDGGIIKIGGEQLGDWDVKGCSATESGPLDISAGNTPLDFWFYEAYGGTCAMLAWNIDNQGWEIVPDSAFLTSYIQSDISTTVPDTSIPSDTTIPTETTWESTTTSTIQQMTTSTIAQSTTVPVTSVPITTIPQTTSTFPPEPTMPDPPATVPLPQIEMPATLDTMPLPPEIESFPPETLELPPETLDTYPTIETFDTLPFALDPPDTMPLPPDTFPDAPETLETLPIEFIAELPPELVEALQNISEDVSLTDEQFATVLDVIADLTESEAVAVIDQILATAVTSDQATELASNPDVLAVVTSEQATEIFATIDVTELDNTQIAELIAVVQDAPTKVRNAFEETINVFGDGLGDYVPLGSNVPVNTRRTLIAVAAGAATVAAGQRRNK